MYKNEKTQDVIQETAHDWEHDESENYQEVTINYKLVPLVLLAN